MNHPSIVYPLFLNSSNCPTESVTALGLLMCSVTSLTDGDEDLADERDGDVLVDEEVDEDAADEGDDPHDQIRRRGEQTVLKQNPTFKANR